MARGMADYVGLVTLSLVFLPDLVLFLPHLLFG